MLRIIEEGFARTGRDAGGAAGRVVALAGGHPQRAMQLADAVWRLTEPGVAADLLVWEAALAEVRNNTDAASERIFELLPSGQRRTLRAIAVGDNIYGRAAELLDLPPATARDAAMSLIGKGVLSRTGKQMGIVGPLLADWLRRRFVL